MISRSRGQMESFPDRNGSLNSENARMSATAIPGRVGSACLRFQRNPASALKNLFIIAMNSQKSYAINARFRRANHTTTAATTTHSKILNNNSRFTLRAFGAGGGSGSGGV